MAFSERLNYLYATLKAEQIGLDVRYMAPEQLPTVESRQVLALAEIVRQLEERVAALEKRAA